MPIDASNAPNANPSDNTQLLGSGGDVISDESIDPNGMVRGSPNLAPTAYKDPRSKIAVGQYGQDQGDATDDTPLAVDCRSARQWREITQVRAADSQTLTEALLNGQQSAYFTLVDNRGSYMDSRGGGVR